LPNHIAYLSGGLRVSTSEDAEATGPRTHILGIVGGFQKSGETVELCIAGDFSLRGTMSSSISENAVQRSIVKRLAVDCFRIAIRPVLQLWAFAANRGAWLAYERLATFQAMGRLLQLTGATWVLESNGILFLEASEERKSLVFTRLARRLEVAAYRRCDAIVCVSEPLKQAIAEHAQVPNDKIAVVPNGVDVEAFIWPRPPRQDIHGELVIGFIGHLYHWQGIEHLLEAVAVLRKDGRDLRLQIGGDGPDRKSMESRASDLGLEGAVQFHGRIAPSEVPEFLTTFDVGYAGHRATRRGMYFSPLKLYEYMAAGLPVLATAWDDARAATGNGRLGFLFEADDARSLEQALLRAWNERQGLELLGALAREEVALHHSWQARAAQIIELARSNPRRRQQHA
jgi:glycosyltransferase involved in cell wall biosynthesis